MSDQPIQGGIDQEADRRTKLARLREQFGISGYGNRVEGLLSLAEARARYNAEADAAHKENPEAEEARPVVKIAGRVHQSRTMGNLIFMTLRDYTGELQAGISKKAVGGEVFKLAKAADLGDIVTVEGHIGSTKTNELTVWASGEEGYGLASKAVAVPPDKRKGLVDPELRYRQRYVDLWANEGVLDVFVKRSSIIAEARSFMASRGFMEVETPMLQAAAGGAAARPFITHLNALDIDLYLRIAPELYLKRLLVGGFPRVYEINRNFRNEGMDRSHNPEFTMMEAYEAFGNYLSMMELTESLVRHLATTISADGIIEWCDERIDYSKPFRKVDYGEQFEKYNGFPMTDFAKVRGKARELGIDEGKLDDWLVVNEVYEATCEHELMQPTFIMHYPAAISPLTRPKDGAEHLCERWDLFIGNMEIGPSYTELNDPEIQESKFREQLKGADVEASTFRTLDEDFLNALKVGMPPAGGLGFGIDRIVMLLTGARSIRDVILFPLMRPRLASGDHAEGSEDTTE